MNLESALKILENVCKAAVGNYVDHVNIQQALKTVKDALPAATRAPGVLPVEVGPAGQEPG